MALLTQNQLKYLLNIIHHYRSAVKGNEIIAPVSKEELPRPPRERTPTPPLPVRNSTPTPPPKVIPPANKALQDYKPPKPVIFQDHSKVIDYFKRMFPYYYYY